MYTAAFTGGQVGVPSGSFDWNWWTLGQTDFWPLGALEISHFVDARMARKTVSVFSFSFDSWHSPWVSGIWHICMWVCLHSLKFHLKISRNAALASSSHLFCQPRELAIVFPSDSCSLVGKYSPVSRSLVEKVQGQANRKLICLCLEYFIAGEINLIRNWIHVPSLALSTN